MDSKIPEVFSNLIGYVVLCLPAGQRARQPGTWNAVFSVLRLVTLNGTSGRSGHFGLWCAKRLSLCAKHGMGSIGSPLLSLVHVPLFGRVRNAMKQVGNGSAASTASGAGVPLPAERHRHCFPQEPHSAQRCLQAAAARLQQELFSAVFYHGFLKIPILM